MVRIHLHEFLEEAKLVRGGQIKRVVALGGRRDGLGRGRGKLSAEYLDMNLHYGSVNISRNP